MTILMKPCEGPDGTIYPSRGAAARAFGVNVAAVQYHLRRHGSLDRMTGAGNTQPVSDGNRSWPSLEAAARDLGVTRSAIWYHLDRYGDLSRIGRKDRRGPTLPLKIGPVSWESRAAAAKALGVSTPTLRVWMGSNATPEQRAKLLERVIEFHQKTARRAA